MDVHTSKVRAVAAVVREGYTVHDGSGESGDNGYGSREYYSKPDSPVNDFGAKLNCASVSKVGRSWIISRFGN